MPFYSKHSNMAYSENFSSENRRFNMEEKIQKSTEYCEQRFSRQPQGDDHENSAIRSGMVNLSSGSQFTSRDNDKDQFNYNSNRHNNSETSSVLYNRPDLTKGQQSPCKNDFKYLG